MADVSGAAILLNAGDGVLAADGSALTLKASSVVANTGHGVRCGRLCDLSFVDSSYNGGAGLLGESTSYPYGWFNDGTLFFNGQNNLFSVGYGISLDSLGSASNSFWTIARNSIVGNRRGGIQVIDATATISGNCIAGNTRNPQSGTQGRAIRVSGQAVIEKNTVVGNDASAIWVGTTQNVPISQNNLEGNAAPILEYGAAASAATLQAANNWWGGANSSDVASLVYDHNDNVSRGYVNFDQPDLAHGPIAGAPATGPCASCIAHVPPDHWRGEYWNNTNLEPRDQPKMVRDDGNGELNVDFGTDMLGSPSLACGISTEAISARWTRQVDFPESGTYRFTVTTDDGFRLFVADGSTPVLDKWFDQTAGVCQGGSKANFPCSIAADCPGGGMCVPNPYSVDVALSAGEHEIKAEWNDRTVHAVAKLSWAPLNPPTPVYTATSTVTLTPRPSPTFTPTATFTKTRTVTPTRTPSITGTRPTAAFTPTPTPSPTGGICAQPKIDLAILIDSSGSIDAGDFELEKEGFASGIEDPSKVPQDGSVCVTVTEFSGTAAEYVSLAAGCITDATAANRIAQSVRTVTATSGDTHVDAAINAAASQFAAHARPDARQIMLLATDGIVNVCDPNARPLSTCPPAPACSVLDAALVAARSAGADEFDVLAIEDPGVFVPGVGERKPLTRDDFTNFYGCRVFPQPNSPGPPPQPGFVVSVGRDFEQFARVVTSTLPALGCATRVDLNDTTGQPGGTSRINATLTKAPGVQVSLAGSEITFDPTLLEADCSSCSINPAIGPGTAADKSLGCGRVDIDAHTARLLVDVLATGNVNPLPDGRLFTCELKPASTLARGIVVPLHNQPSAVASDSTLVATLGRDGSITVSGCPGDCDGDGEVGLDEVGRAVLLFLGIPPSVPCPAADVNGDGQVRIGEVVQAIDARYQRCGR